MLSKKGIEMFCTNCGLKMEKVGRFCASCGTSTEASSVQVPPVVQTPPPSYPPMLPPYQKKASNQGLGLGITSLIIGVVTLVFAFIDLAGIDSGDYAYIFLSEIGLLFLMSVAGITFGGISARAENAVGRAGLTLSIGALLFTFYLTRFAG